MKLARTTLLLTAFAAVSTLSCQKAAETPQPAPPPPAPVAQAPATGTPAAPATAAPAAPAAAGAVADLPEYPGAVRVRVESETKAGFARSVEVKLVTKDSAENVRKFYLEAIAANGWQVTGTKEKPGEIKWILAKGTSVGKVEVETESLGGVKIKLERQDR